MKNINKTNMSTLIKAPIAFIMAIAARVYVMDKSMYASTLAYGLWYEFDAKRGVHVFFINDPGSDGEYGTDLKVEVLDSTGNYRWCTTRYYCSAIYGEYKEYTNPWEYSLPVVTRRSNRSSRKHGKWHLLNVWE